MALVPSNYPDLLRAAGLTVTTVGDWYNNTSGSADHDAVCLHWTASSRSGSPSGIANDVFYGAADAPLYNVLVDRYGCAWVGARHKSNNAGNISSVAFNEAIQGRTDWRSAASRSLRDDTVQNSRLFAIAAQNDGVGEPWAEALKHGMSVAAAVTLECLGLSRSGYTTHHMALTARKIDLTPGTGGCPDGGEWNARISEAMQGGAPAPSGGDDDMRACTDDDGGIYVFGPGIFEHATGESWGSWERFTGPALRVNNRQRDLIRETCLSAGDAVWGTLLDSRTQTNAQYAAADILTSAERYAKEAAE